MSLFGLYKGLPGTQNNSVAVMFTGTPSNQSNSGPEVALAPDRSAPMLY